MRSALMAVVAALAVVSVAQAQNMEPLSYTNSPVGLNFLIAGYSYQSGNVLVDPSLPVHNVEARVDNATLAYSHIFDCWGQSGSVALAMPYSRLSASGDLLEQERSVVRVGVGDVALRLSVNLYGAPALSLGEFAGYHQDLIIGTSVVVVAPSGQYIASKLANIGTNRWSFQPSVGVSKAVKRWTFEVEGGPTFFTDNDHYLGDNTRHEEPLYSLQGHAIYNFTRKLWVALDATYYTGGRTSTNGGALDNDLERNSRWGSTVAFSLTRRNSAKVYFSSGLTAQSGADFRTIGVAWQYRFGAGL
jgi:Putative MetA-pathway of phenol degradation